MTVPSNLSVAILYPGDNVSNAFPIPFPTFENSDILASIESTDGETTNLAIDTDYTLSGIGRPGFPSTLTLVDNAQAWVNGSGNLVTGYKLLIRYTNVGVQSARLRDLGRFATIEIEKALDRFALTLKSLKYDVGNALTLAGDEAGVSGQFPPLAGAGGQAVIVLPDELGFGYIPFPDALPAGGDEGAALVRDNMGEAVWDNIEFTGFSSRFNTAWSSKGLMDTLSQIIALTYLGPLIASFTGTSNTLREKGDTVSSITLSVNVTRRTDLIARILFRQGATTIEDYNPPVNTGSGVTTANYATPFSDNITFTVEVTDDGAQGGPTTVSSNVTYSFVYPYYRGVGAVGLSAAAVAGLTKDVINSNANLTRSFGAASGEVYYFAYPASYGALTAIFDENEFNVFSSWTMRTENITGLDGNPVSYRIYEFNNVVSAGATTFRFVR